MTPDIDYIRGSDGSGEAVRATVTSARSVSATTLQVDAVTNYPDKFIATTGVLNEETGYLDPETLTIFYAELDGANIEILDFAPGYSDIGNAVGDVVVLKPTTPWADNIADLLALVLSPAGALNDTAIGQVIGAGKTAENLRVKPRIIVDDTTATLTPNIDSYNVYELNAQAETLTIAAPTGTPNDGDVLIFRLKAAGANRTASWNAAYTNVSGLDALTTLLNGKWHYVGIMWNAAATKWQIISITTEA